MADSFGMGIVRTELNHMNRGTRRILKDTIGVFRHADSDLIHAVCDHMDTVFGSSSSARLNVVEALVHRTKHNPDPEYKDFDIRYYKLPSYIRRAAINDAIGYVQSHETRCDDYYANRDLEIARGHHYKKMEPAFTYTPNACPTLYRSSSGVLKMDGCSVSIKAYVRNTWDWIEVSIPQRDYKRLVLAASRGTVLNPKLVFEYNKFYLEFPVKYNTRKFPRDVPLEEQTVLAVDLGLNHGAACSVVDASGTILAREFDPFKADTDRILHIINLIRRKAASSGKGQSLASLYTRLRGLKENFAKQLSRWIVNLAVQYHVYGIVLENLGSIHKRGKKRGSLRSRVHHWAVCHIRDYITGMALREGIRVFRINPKGTSMYAYDGSGQVVRDANNYSLCTFASGKRYNADLSASYNIGARYFLRAQHKSIPATEWSELEAKVPGLSKRTTWTLDALRRVCAARTPEAAIPAA